MTVGSYERSESLQPPRSDVVVSAEDSNEAAALAVALTAGGLPALPGSPEAAPDGTVVVLLRRNGFDEDEIGRTSAGVTVVAAGPADEAAMLTAVEQGALAYIEADASYERFVATVAAAVRGEATVPPQMLGALLQRVIEQQREQREASQFLDVLTPRERQVFGLVVQGADKHSIAESLYISPETARTHIQNVMTKLGTTSRVELVGLAATAGLPVVSTEGALE